VHRVHALRCAVVKQLHHELRGHRGDHVIDLARHVEQRRIALEALYLVSLRVHGIELARVLHVQQRHQEAAAGTWLRARPDDRDALRVKQKLQRVLGDAQ
jgi:hypothetical protein